MQWYLLACSPVCDGRQFAVRLREELGLVLVAMGVALVEAGQPYVPSINAYAE